MMKRFEFRTIFAGIAVGVVAVFVSVVVNAADTKPPNDLTQLVGDDVGLCVEIRDLAGQIDRFRKSDVFRRLQRVPGLQQALKSAELQDLQKARQQIEQQLGKDNARVDQLAGELFGRSVVFAVYPNGKTGPSGVMLLQASGTKSLDEALNLWNRIDEGHNTEERTHLGHTYVRRSPRDGRRGSVPTLYYARLDQVFALSDREEMIRNVLRLKGAKKSLAQSRYYRDARSALRGKPVVTAYLNPRAWDGVLKSPASESDVPLPLQFWRSCRWMMGSMQLDDGVVVDAVFDYDAKLLPDVWQHVIKTIDGPNTVLDRVPANALIAIVGRFDPAVIRSLLAGSEHKPAARPAQKARYAAKALLLGFDVVDDLLPRLNREFTLFLVGRTAKDEATPPWDVLFATGLTPPNGTAADWNARLEHGMANVLQMAATWYNLNQNEKADGVGAPAFATVEKSSHSGVTIHWIHHLAGFQPGFALTPHYLVLAGSPEIIRQFQAGPGDQRLIDQAAFRYWKGRYFPEHNQLVFLNTALLRQHLRQNLPAITHWWVKTKSIKPVQAKPALLMAGQVLSVMDGVFYAAHVGSSRIRLTFGVVTKPAQ